jgi:hypothetical protein
LGHFSLSLELENTKCSEKLLVDCHLETKMDRSENPSNRILRLFTTEVQGDGLVYARAMRWITYAVLLAGVSDKAEATKAVPDLSAVLSYPTTVFIGRDGAVRWIHSGFAGPGTGRHHEELVAEMEERIELLLSETPP